MPHKDTYYLVLLPLFISGKISDMQTPPMMPASQAAAEELTRVATSCQLAKRRKRNTITTDIVLAKEEQLLERPADVVARFCHASRPRSKVFSPS